MLAFKIQVYIHGLPETTSSLDITKGDLWFYIFCPETVHMKHFAAERLQMTLGMPPNYKIHC